MRNASFEKKTADLGWEFGDSPDQGEEDKCLFDKTKPLSFEGEGSKGEVDEQSNQYRRLATTRQIIKQRIIKPAMIPPMSHQLMGVGGGVTSVTTNVPDKSSMVTL